MLLVSVEGQSLKNMERDQLSMFLKGAPNSTISVEIERQGNVIKKEINKRKS